MKILTEPHEVVSRLSELDLPEEDLRDAVLAGELGRAECTSLDPVATPGTEAWRWATRRLRERKIPDGWRPVDKRNLPLTLNPASGVAVAVSSGTVGTGLKEDDRQPTTKNPKGSVVDGFVRFHRVQLLIPGMEDRLSFLPTPKANEMMVWFLLVFFDGETAHSELSLPSSMDESGFIREWNERILLAPLSHDDLFVQRREGDDFEPDVDVQVTPR